MEANNRTGKLRYVAGSIALQYISYKTALDDGDFASRLGLTHLKVLPTSGDFISQPCQRIPKPLDRCYH